jgi:hypothetical protein
MTLSNRKPRIALMGEFSAGKSTLSNLLLGARPLPEKVTATRLSPVWMSLGDGTPYRVDVDGNEEPIVLTQLEGIDVDSTRVIRLFFDADILQVCDLIDFPGISDPNMSADVWQRMLCEVDAVIWCTHATQAWRQSEAAVWDTIPEAVRQKSTLLVTRFDKLTTERDRFRVLARLRKETSDLFGATFPISLTEALAAGEDDEAFENSGGGAFLEHLIPLIDELYETIGGTEETLFEMASGENMADVSTDSSAQETSETATEEEVVNLENGQNPEHHPDLKNDDVGGQTNETAERDTPRIMPKRIRAKGVPSTARPKRPSAPGQVVSMNSGQSVITDDQATNDERTQLKSFLASDQDVEKDTLAS